MGKGQIRKKALSKHSREARRATSPGINADKSLKEVKLPETDSNHRPAILAAHSNAGVSKKTSKRKSVLSFRARRRQDKVFARAETVVEKTVLKVEKSKVQAKVVTSRSKDWEKINKGIDVVPKHTSLFEVLGNNDDMERGGEWEDVDKKDDLDDTMEEAEQVAPEQPISEAAASGSISLAPLPQAVTAGRDNVDEIL